jgi:TorA maturation chaperone TorD
MMAANSLSNPQAVAFENPRLVDVEDQVRADFYALLAHLLSRAPDDRVLQSIVITQEPTDEASTALTEAWRALSAASAVVTHDALVDEYEAVFVGVGRPPVILYGSFYIAGFMMEKPLAELRDDLAKMGFLRNSEVRESEDHLAAVCDVMRALILGDLADAPAEITAQKVFFEKHLKPWVFKCCTAIQVYEKSNYYKRVAKFAEQFFAMESEAFEMQH